MNKLLSLLALFIVTNNTLSQVGIGFTAGANYGKLINLEIDFPYDFQSTFSWRMGFETEYTYRSKWQLSSGFFVTGRGGIDKMRANPIYSGRIMFWFFEVPMVISRCIYKDRLFLGLGILNSWPQSYGYHFFEERDYHLDLTARVKYQISNRLSIQGSYLFGNINSYIDKDKLLLFSTGNFSAQYNFFKYPKR